MLAASASAADPLAADVSAGQFGQNTGGGDYSFPAKLGIGTASPAQTLDVAGNIGISGTEIVTSGRLLQNVAADAGIVTSGTLADARLSANVTLLGNSVSGSGAVVLASSPTITTPTIASFVNATHSHQNAAGGGTLNGAAIASGTVSASYLPVASATAAGIVSTGTQTFAGAKTFQGSVFPSADYTYDLGSSAYRWRVIYCSSGYFDYRVQTSAGYIWSGTYLKANSYVQSMGAVYAGTFVDAGTYVNAASGYKYNNTANSGYVLRGNGTYYVGARLAASDLSDGVTGSGAVVLAGSPTITTPTIASFVNATHNHQNAAGGGTLDAAAIASGAFDPARIPNLDASKITSGTLDDGRLPSSMSGKTFSGNVLPSSTGLDLGSAAQRWDVFGANGDFTGNVGIGASSPSEKLDIVGNVEWGANTPKGRLLDVGSGDIQVRSNANAANAQDDVSKPSWAVRFGPQYDDFSIHRAPPGSGAFKQLLTLDNRGALNQILFLTPGSGIDPTDDGRAINDAVAALPANGGIIMLTPGTYNIHTTIRVTKSGVKIRGYGNRRISFSDDSLSPLTNLVWGGASGGTVVEFVPPVANDRLRDLELSDLNIDGGGIATTGLVLNRVTTSRFCRVTVTHLQNNPNTIGIKLTTDADAAHPQRDTAFNYFDSCEVDFANKGIVLTSDPLTTPSDCSQNVFVNTQVAYYAAYTSDAGILLEHADANVFHKTGVYRAGTLGHGVVLDTPDHVHANYFYHLLAENGVHQLVAGWQLPPDGKNIIFGLTENSPVSADGAPPEKHLCWTTHNGQIRGMPDVTVGFTFNEIGTVTVNAGSTLVEGTGTQFQSDVDVKDRVTVETTAGSETRTVVGVSSPLELTVDAPFNGSGSGKTMQVTKGSLSVSGNASVGGSLSCAGAKVISDQRVLQNVAAAAGIITSGVFGTDRIPNLDASKITSGAFDPARVPGLDASKIVSGTLNSDRVPSLDASKIGSGTISDARLPADLLHGLTGSGRKAAWGWEQVPGSSYHVISSGLSNIDCVLTGHKWMNTEGVQPSVSNTQGGSFHLHNPATTEEVFYWLAIGT